MLDQPTKPDDRRNVREARAQAFLEQDLKGQRQWYSQRSSAYKTRAQMLSLFVLAAGAATTFVQVFRDVWWISILTAGLGALVILTEGWQRIARYNETWIAYRTASERLKREQRLYVNGAGLYRNPDEEEAYVQFVESVEAVLAEEQQIYWQAQRSDGARLEKSAAKVQ